MSATHRARFSIAADHPALPGHFPGEPVVPGVVVIDRVMAAAQAWLAREVSPHAFAQIKFLSPLLPGEEAQITLSLDDARLRFEVGANGRAIARGDASLRDEVAR